MKIIIAFFLGLGLASAIGQTVPGVKRDVGVMAYLNAGVDPDKNARAIQVDHDGYVICSDHHKGETK